MFVIGRSESSLPWERLSDCCKFFVNSAVAASIARRRLTGSGCCWLASPSRRFNSSSEELAPSHPAHKTIQEVIASVNRAELVSHQLLAFSGKSLVRDIKINLTTEIRELLALLTPAMLEDVRLSLELSDDFMFIQFDRAELQQVLFNIILNAVEATKPKGTVTVTAGKQGNMIEVKVVDTGIGIKPDDIDRIFDPLYTSKPKGHGLGLAAVQRIILAHNGEIRIKSEPGAGTEMLVLLPSYEVQDT